MSLVTTKWLKDNFDKVKIIDCSWHMPQTKRVGYDEFKKTHIANAIFFNLDDNSKKDIDLISKAIDFSSKAHNNQKRKSGEPYINHPIEVSIILGI